MSAVSAVNIDPAAASCGVFHRLAFSLPPTSDFLDWYREAHKVTDVFHVDNRVWQCDVRGIEVRVQVLCRAVGLDNGSHFRNLLSGLLVLSFSCCRGCPHFLRNVLFKTSKLLCNNHPGLRFVLCTSYIHYAVCLHTISNLDST